MSEQQLEQASNEQVNQTSEEFAKEMNEQIAHSARAFGVTAKEMHEAGIHIGALVTGAMSNFTNLITASGVDAGKTSEEIKAAIRDSVEIMENLSDRLFAEITQAIANIDSEK